MTKSLEAEHMSSRATSIETQLLTADIIKNGSPLDLRGKSTHCNCYDYYVSSIQLDFNELTKNSAFKEQVRNKLGVSGVTTVEIDIDETDIKIRVPGQARWISIYSDISDIEERSAIDAKMAQIIEKTRNAYANFLANHGKHTSSPLMPQRITHLEPQHNQSNCFPLSPSTNSRIEEHVQELEDTVRSLQRQLASLSRRELMSEESPQERLDSKSFSDQEPFENERLIHTERLIEEALREAENQYEQNLKRVTTSLHHARRQAQDAQFELEQVQLSHANEVETLVADRNLIYKRVQMLENKIKELGKAQNTMTTSEGDLEDENPYLLNLKSLSNQLNELALANDSLRQAQKNHALEVQTLTTELNDKNQLITTLKEELHSVKNTHQKKTTDLSHQLRIAEQENAKLLTAREATRSEAVLAHQNLGLERILHAETSKRAGQEISRLQDQLEDAGQKMQAAQLKLEQTQLSHADEVKALIADHNLEKERIQTLKTDMARLKENYQFQIENLSDQMRVKQKKTEELSQAFDTACEKRESAEYEITNVRKELELLQTRLAKQKQILDQAKSIVEGVVTPKEVTNLAEELMGRGIEPSELGPFLKEVHIEAYQVGGDNYHTLPRQLEALIARNEELHAALAKKHARYDTLYQKSEALLKDDRKELDRIKKEAKAEIDSIQRQAAKEIERIEAITKKTHAHVTERNRNLAEKVKGLESAVQAYEASKLVQDAEIDRLERVNTSQNTQLTESREKVIELEAITQESNDTILAKERKIGDLQKAYRQLKEERDSARHDAISYQEDLASEEKLHKQKFNFARQEIANLEDQLKKIKQEYQESSQHFSDQLDDADQKAQAAQLKFEQIQLRHAEEVETLTSSHNSAKERIQMLEADMTRLKENYQFQIENLSSQMRVKQKEAEGLSQAFDTACEKRESAEYEMTNVRKELELLQTRLAKQKQILDQAKSIVEGVVTPKEVTNLAEELMGRGIEPSELGPFLKEVHIEAYQVGGDNYHTLPRQLEALIARNEELHATLAKEHARYDTLYQKSEALLKDDRKELDRIKKEAKVEIDSIQRQAAKEVERIEAITKKTHAHVTERNRNLAEEVKSLKSAVQAYETSKLVQGAEIDRLERVNTSQNTQLTESREKVTELEAITQESNDTILAKERKIGDLQKAYRQLENDLDSFKEISEEEAILRQSVEKRVQSLTQKLEDAEKQISTLANNLTSKDEELTELREVLHVTQQENTRLNEAIVELKNENEALERLLAKTKEIASELSAEFNSLDIRKSINTMSIRAFQVVHERDLNLANAKTLQSELHQVAKEAYDTQRGLANRIRDFEAEKECLKEQIQILEGTVEYLQRKAKQLKKGEKSFLSHLDHLSSVIAQETGS